MNWLPRTLFGRMLLLISAGLVLAQAAGTAIFLFEQQRSLGHTLSHEVAQRVDALYRTLDSRPEPEQAALAASLSTPRLRLGIDDGVPAAVAPPPAAGWFSRGEELAAHLQETLGPGATVRFVTVPRMGSFAFDMRVRLSSGRWLAVKGSAPDDVFAWPWRLLVNLALMLIAVVALVAMTARSVTRPLVELASAARRLSTDLRQPPLPERGPTETRDAVRAFNLMQARIRAGIEERERFLAAVSHDLKTPVTRLRLRSEMLADPELRERYIADLDEMQHLLEGALDYLRGKAVDEPVQVVDIVALVESLVDDYAGLGEVSLAAPEALQCPARPRALRRALMNLIDNALRYGRRAQVTLRHGAGSVEILVEDEGPGVEPEELERVFEPFHRLEGSRNRETGGSGLGLAIARHIARAQGGDITLANRPEGGLRALLTLPHEGKPLAQPERGAA
jgi:signal transduction histidine kinase